LIAGALWTGYGYFVKDKKAEILICNGIGIAAATAYVAVYALWSTKEARKQLIIMYTGIWGAWCVLFGFLYGTTIGDAFEQRGTMVAVIAIVFNIMLLGSPLQSISEALKNLDASRVPIMMSIVGLFCSITWGLYGVMIDDYFVAFPNGVGVLLAGVQFGALRYIKNKVKHQKSHVELTEVSTQQAVSSIARAISTKISQSTKAGGGVAAVESGMKASASGSHLLGMTATHEHDHDGDDTRAMIAGSSVGNVDHWHQKIDIPQETKPSSSSSSSTPRTTDSQPPSTTGATLQKLRKPRSTTEGSCASGAETPLDRIVRTLSHVSESEAAAAASMTPMGGTPSARSRTRAPSGIVVTA
jgi:hypothetical protein